MIFSDRGRKKQNFFPLKDPMAYNPDGKYIKHFEVPTSNRFVPYDGSKQYSLEKKNPEGLFFDQDSKRKEHDKMKQEYFDYCQYMMSLGKQPKSQQQYHNDIMNLAARPSTRDLKQAKQKLYAQELQKQIEENNKQRFASQPNRNTVKETDADVNENEVQAMNLKQASNFFTPSKKSFGGAGDPLYDEYGQINANIRGISEKLNEGNIINPSSLRNNNKILKGSRTTLGDGYFQEYKSSNLQSQLKKQQQQFQQQMEQEGKNVMDKIFERQEERQQNRFQRHNDYMRDIEKQIQENNFSIPSHQQDRMVNMSNYHHRNQSIIEQNQQKYMFQEMPDDYQQRKMQRDVQLEKQNNDLQQQLEIKRQQKKMLRDIDKLKEEKEEAKLQKEREEIRKQIEAETLKRKKLIQDTDAENQKIIEQQKKLQKNQQKLQEQQNNLINEAMEMQNKLKSQAASEARKFSYNGEIIRVSQHFLDIPQSAIQSQQDFNEIHPSALQSQYQSQLPSVANNQFGYSSSIYPINSTPFNQLKQKPSQYPPIPEINPIQKLNDQQQEKQKEQQQNNNYEEFNNLHSDFQEQTQKIQKEILQLREDLMKQQKQSEEQQQNILSTQEKFIANEISKLEEQLKKQQNQIIQAQTQAIQLNKKNDEEKKSALQSKDFLKEAQDDIVKQLKEQQRQIIEEHKDKLQEEKQKRESDQQKHVTEKLIQDFNVDMQKRDIKDEMRYKLLKNKIKELDKQQDNTILLKTAIATLQQTPGSQRIQDESEDYSQNKQNTAYQEGDENLRTIPVIKQYFNQNPSNQEQIFSSNRLASQPNSPNILSVQDGFNTERQINKDLNHTVITQHFHYDMHPNPRKSLSSQQRRKKYKQYELINSAIQTDLKDFSEEGLKMDQQIFIKEMQPLHELECRKKRSCSINENKRRLQTPNFELVKSGKFALPTVKRRESIDNIFKDQEEVSKIKQNPNKFNQAHINLQKSNGYLNDGYNNASSYIDAWNSTIINDSTFQNQYNNLSNNSMNDFLNNTLLTSPQSYNQTKRDQSNNKQSPHQLFQSSYLINNKLRSSSLYTDQDQKQKDNSPNLFDNDNLINKNLDILDAIVKASNHNRTKSSQRRSVKRYNDLTQKDLERESQTTQNYYSPLDQEFSQTGIGLYSNPSPIQKQSISFNEPNTHIYIQRSPQTYRTSKQNPAKLNMKSAKKVITQLDEILSDIKSGNVM